MYHHIHGDIMKMKMPTKNDHICVNTTYLPNMPCFQKYVSKLGTYVKQTQHGHMVTIHDTQSTHVVPIYAITYANDHYHIHNMNMGLGYWGKYHNFPSMVITCPPKHITKNGDIA